MAKKDPKSPATTSAAYDVMAPRWQLLDTVLAGTEAMRAAGKTYLPQHEKESDTNYHNRLTSVVLENMYELTLDGLAGKPFKEDIKVNDDVPKKLVEDILEDVDLQGSELDIFCAEWFRAGVHKGFCHVLVDHPRPAERADGQKRSLADDRREGLRPYWVLVDPLDVIFMEAQIVDGVEVLTHVRIKEMTVVRDGFAEVVEERIRVLEPGNVTLYMKDRRGKWNIEDEWDTGLDFIPLVTFYAKREGLALCKPPLLDLAHLNVTHWQSASDQRAILTVARFPMLAGSGARDETGQVKAGPHTLLWIDDPQGKYYYVEHTGASIEAGRNDLKDLKEAMSAYGAEFLREQPGDETATGRALDSAEASTPLGKMAKVFEDSVAVALDFTAAWLKLPEGRGGTVELSLEFEFQKPADGGLTALKDARTNRDISRETYLDGLKRRGVLPEDFDPEKDAALLADEQELMASEIDLDPGAPNAPAEAGEEGDNPGQKKPPGSKPPVKE